VLGKIKLAGIAYLVEQVGRAFGLQAEMDDPESEGALRILACVMGNARRKQAPAPGFQGINAGADSDYPHTGFHGDQVVDFEDAARNLPMPGHRLSTGNDHSGCENFK